MAPQSAPSRGSNLLQFALIFATVYIGSQFVLRYAFPQQFGGQPAVQGVHLRLKDASLTTGHHPVLLLENHTATGVTLRSRCPAPPVDVFLVEDGDPERLLPLSATGSVTGCEMLPALGPGETQEISLAPWKFSLFARTGAYELRLPPSVASSMGSAPASGSGEGVTPRSPDTLSARLTVGEPGALTKLFRVLILAPFLNFLIFIASLLPGHSLGISIILLTVVVKSLLYLPTKHALEGQKKMQLLQPKMDALKQRYKDDPKQLQEETMKLWKQEKINPFQSCLPTVIQLPVLIGLFYVIRDSSTLEASRHLIYPVYQHLTWDFGTLFLGLDLLKPAPFIMPPLLVVLQFLQMKLAFSIQARKKKAKSEVIDVTPKGEKQKKQPLTPAGAQQQAMLYGLPLMIGFFAISFPSAVALYWGVSTLFGIAQQLLVNREHLKLRA